MAAIPQPLAHSAFHGWIGVARRDITPPAGIYARNWGAAAGDVAEGIHRPLTLSAMVLLEKQGGSPLVLIAADLGWWREESTERALRKPILAALDLPPARLIVNLSHTHAGPALSPSLAHLLGGEKIGPYLDHLRESAVAAVRSALAAAQPGVLEWTAGRCDLARNRDLPDPHKPRYLTGLNPAAPADDTLLVGRVTAGGAIVATLVNYACHPVTLAWDNRLISPDYVGAMREVVESATSAPCLFLQGASGELAPAEEYVGDPAIADAHGRHLGYAALSALAGMLPAGMELVFAGIVESGAPLAMWTRRPRGETDDMTRLAALEFSAPLAIKKGYPSAAEIERRLAANTDRILGERLRRQLAVRQSLGDGSHASFGQWIWRVGQTVFVGIPHEAYSHLQIELRRRFSPLTVVVMNLVNGSTGYLPPAALYGQDLYQVWQSPFERGCLEQEIEVCDAGIRRMLAESA